MEQVFCFSKAVFSFIVGSIIFSSCSQQAVKSLSSEVSLTQCVDPFIGTGFHGHVFLGANVPFGAVQLGPVNMSQGWDWCSGYHYSDSTVLGFAHISPVSIENAASQHQDRNSLLEF